MATDEGVIRVRYTNLYKFPVVDGNVVACLVKGTPLQILDETEEFFKVRFCNQEAYVLKQCLGAARITERGIESYE